MLGKIQDFLNKNIGLIFTIFLALCGTGIWSIAFDNGKILATVEALTLDVQANATAIQESEKSVLAKLDQIEQQIAINQLDLKEILISTGIADADDVFYAAGLPNGEVWLFPSPMMEARLLEEGFSPQKVNSYLSGFQVLPAGAINP